MVLVAPGTCPEMLAVWVRFGSVRQLESPQSPLFAGFVQRQLKSWISVRTEKANFCTSQSLVVFRTLALRFRMVLSHSKHMFPRGKVDYIQRKWLLRAYLRRGLFVFGCVRRLRQLIRQNADLVRGRPLVST